MEEELIRKKIGSFAGKFNGVPEPIKTYPPLQAIYPPLAGTNHLTLLSHPLAFPHLVWYLYIRIQLWITLLVYLVSDQKGNVDVTFNMTSAIHNPHRIPKNSQS